jgi:RecA/RadA recombinase
MGKLSTVVTKYTKKLGEGTIIRGSECMVDYPRLPTGVYAIDYAIGGGVPVGVTSSLYGPPNGGKTMISILLMASAQNLCWNCFQYLWDCNCGEKTEKDVLMVSTEIFDVGWAALFGVNAEKLWVVEPETGEIAAEIIADSLRSKDCGLVVLDSLPMLVPASEIEGNIADITVAVQARMIAAMMRKVKAILIRQRKPHIANNVAFVATNQIRAKIGKGFGKGPSEEMAGGFVPMHDWHLTLRMSQPYSSDRDKTTELPINGKFKASLIAMGNKRKLFVMAGSGEFYAVIGDGGPLPKGTINDFKTVARIADRADLINKKGWWLFDHEYGTKTEMLNDWVSNKERFLSVKKTLVNYFAIESKERMSEASIGFEPPEEEDGE